MSTAQVDAADAQGTEMEGKITLAALQERGHEIPWNRNIVNNNGK